MSKMIQISLIVEGEEDLRFLQDFIDFHFAKEINKNSFITIGGKSEAIHLSSTKIETSTSAGKSNIIVFDADYTDYPSTLSNIEKEAERLSLKIDSIFLFPNNMIKGNLESLLINSVVKENERLFDCIDDYAACKVALNLKRPSQIGEKEKLLIYHGSFNDSGEAKGSKRSYLDKDIWDLSSPALNPLKEFLHPFFIE